MLTRDIEQNIVSSSAERLVEIFREYGYEKTRGICSEINALPENSVREINKREQLLKIRYAIRTIGSEYKQIALVNNIKEKHESRIVILEDGLNVLKSKVDKLHKDEKTGIAETVNRCVVSISMLAGFIFLLYIAYVIVESVRRRFSSSYLSVR